MMMVVHKELSDDHEMSVCVCVHSVKYTQTMITDHNENKKCNKKGKHLPLKPPPLEMPAAAVDG